MVKHSHVHVRCGQGGTVLNNSAWVLNNSGWQLNNSGWVLKNSGWLPAQVSMCPRPGDSNIWEPKTQLLKYGTEILECRAHSLEGTAWFCFAQLADV